MMSSTQPAARCRAKLNGANIASIIVPSHTRRSGRKPSPNRNSRLRRKCSSHCTQPRSQRSGAYPRTPEVWQAEVSWGPKLRTDRSHLPPHAPVAPDASCFEGAHAKESVYVENVLAIAPNPAPSGVEHIQELQKYDRRKSPGVRNFARIDRASRHMPQ